MHAQIHLVQNALDALHRINSLLLLQSQLVNVAIPARMDLGQHRLSHLQIVTNSNVGHRYHDIFCGDKSNSSGPAHRKCIRGQCLRGVESNVDLDRHCCWLLGVNDGLLVQRTSCTMEGFKFGCVNTSSTAPRSDIFNDKI